jgi:hypothetical protein
VVMVVLRIAPVVENPARCDTSPRGVHVSPNEVATSRKWLSAITIAPEASP